MLIFIDTEFTNLIPGNKLISIALVAEDGQFFYAELTDTYSLSDCSDFVKTNVLPYLKGGEFSMSESVCALKITDWIESRGADCRLACDNIWWDLPHLIKLIDKTGLRPENLQLDNPYKFMITDIAVESIVNKYNFHIHNALDDASVMRIAYTLGEAQEY